MRQLAAILFADMTGYTALMQENESLARDKRRKLFKKVTDASGKEVNDWPKDIEEKRVRAKR